ncbi:MAG TPA: hybrid sensor histidine kinase/response regulator, partial [Caulobacter sp.]|nr:hybrid sensor histidine kinase/response regulator [Caulobacter sp.]
MSRTAVQRDVARAAASRRANTYLRIGATLSIATLLQIYIHEPWCWPWAALYTLAHSFELWASHPLVDRPEAPIATWRRAVAFVSPFITSAAFGALSIPLFASHIRFAPTLGGMLLAGALLNVVVVNARSRSATVMAASPHALYLLVAPFVAKSANAGANLADVLWFGALLMIASVALASRTLHAALK